MGLALKIANRLRLNPEGKGRRQSPGVTVAVAGIAVSVAVMLLTLAVVKGFQNQVKQKVMGFDSQISVARYVTNSEDTPFLNYSDSLLAVIKSSLPENAVLSPAVTCTSLLKTDEDYLGLMLVADDNTLQNYIANYVIEGSDTLLADDNSIVVSSLVAKRLNLQKGDRIFAHFFINGGVKSRRLTVSAIYDTSFGERDKRVAFCSLPLLRSVYGIAENQAEKINITGLDFDAVQPLSESLQLSLAEAFYEQKVSDIYQVDSVLRTGAAYFGWLDLLDTNVVVIIILMSLVAAFTLVASLFILVLERVRMIGVLKSLGATDGFISRIFMFLAMRIVAIGLFAGNVAGLLIIFLQDYFHLIPLDPDAYYLDYVPVDLSLTNIILLNISAIFAAWLVLILPSMIVSRISPAATIRYE